ncbi:MAG: hypothetical protein ABJZ69_15110 [Hyphomicrobiales bacterium]
MLDTASLSPEAGEVAGMDREFLYFEHNAETSWQLSNHRPTAVDHPPR